MAGSVFWQANLRLVLTPMRMERACLLYTSHMLKERAVKLYEAKEAEFPEEEMIRELERVVLLKTIDRKLSLIHI